MYKNSKMIIAKLIILLILTKNLYADDIGPFGVNSETNIAKIETCELSKEKLTVYSCSHLPKDHDTFKDFIVFYAEGIGVCKIIAVSKVIDTNVYGAGLKNEVDIVSKQISEKYGTFRKFDFLMAGSIWREPNEWMRSLIKKERYYSYYWSKETKFKQQHNISSITMDAVALDQNNGTIALTFEFENFNKCKEIENKKAKNAF